MKKFKNILLRVLMFTAAVITVSCKSDSEQDLILKRQFEPAAFDITNGETSVVIAWDNSLFTTAGDVQYKVELSKDISFSSVEVTKTTTESTLTFLDTDIDIRVDYYARVKAIGTSPTADSNWLISEAFRITGELFILPIAESDVVVNEAIIHWEAGHDIAKVVLTPVTGSPTEVSVTSEQDAAGEIEVTDLTPSTTYNAEIFASDGVSKGSVEFTTKPSYEGSNIIDLTGITGKPSILADTLPDIPSGSVVLLKRGELYTISAVMSVDRSVTIVSGADFNPTFATIKFTSNFNLIANSNIDSLVFKDLNMYSDNYTSRYVFNISQIGTIGTVRFDNCRGHRFRGFFRMQTGTTGTQVTNFFMNNCVVDSLRDFSLVNTNNLNTVANILVTNSTIYNARKVIDHRSPGSNSIAFRNCTFNNMPSSGAAGGGTTYFIDLDVQNSTGGVEITNCIFSKSWDDQALGNDARGIRVGATTSVNTTNSYALSDFVSTNALYQIPGLITYTGSSTAVFTDFVNGNFTIKDGAFPGHDNAGDPRWRQ